MNNLLNINHLHLNFGVRNISISQSHNIRFLFLNINRLPNKIQRMEFFLNQLNVNVDVIMLCETWVRPSEIPAMNLKGFTACHRLRNNNARARTNPGGFAIFVKNTLTANLINDNLIDSINSDGHEFLMVNVSDFNCNVCVTYRRPVADIQVYICKLDKLLDHYKGSVVAGDINLNLLENNTNSSSLLNTLSSNGFNLLNSLNQAMYTRISNSGFTSVIDHFYSDIPNLSNCVLAIGDNDLSDHRFMLLAYETGHPAVAWSHSTPMKSANYFKVAKLLPKIDHSSFSSFHNCLK